MSQKPLHLSVTNPAPTNGQAGKRAPPLSNTGWPGRHHSLVTHQWHELTKPHQCTGQPVGRPRTCLSGRAVWIVAPERHTTLSLPCLCPCPLTLSAHSVLFKCSEDGSRYPVHLSRSSTPRYRQCSAERGRMCSSERRTSSDRLESSDPCFFSDSPSRDPGGFTTRYLFF